MLVFIVVTTLVWALFIGFSIYVATPYLLDIEIFPIEIDSRNVSGFVFAFGLAFLLTFFRRMESLIGVVPRFRVGMHGGPVVIGEVGDSRRAIVYFGDTVSHAVALQSACKRVGHDFLVSADLMEKLRIGKGFASRFLGSLELFPDGATVDAYAMSSERCGGSRSAACG